MKRLFLHMAALLAASHVAAAASKPNIVFLFADDQTPAYLSCYGGRTPTPNLDRLAKEGMRFTSAHSVTPLCNPSRYTVLTGQFPGRNPRMIESAKPGEAAIIHQDSRLTPETPCIAEMLREAGYFTGYLGKWHSNFELKALGVENLPPMPENPDAPDANAVFAERQRLFTLAIRKAARFEHVSHVVWGNQHGSYPVVHNPEWLTDGAIEFIEKAVRDGRPFFLHVANTAPHAPDICKALEVDPRYTLSGKLAEPPKSHPPRMTIPERLKAAGLPVSAQQVGALMLDDQAGAILAALERLGIADNTLIVYAQDNGQLGKGSCYAGGTHSALVMRWPQGIKAGRVGHTPVSFVDFVPTFLAMAGAGGPAGYKADGVNLLNDEVESRAAIYCEAGVARAVVKGKYRYIAFRPTPSQIAEMESGGVKTALDTWGNAEDGDNHWLIPYKPAFFDPDQLYDMEADPLERTNLAGDPKFAPVVAEMQAELQKYLATMPTPFPPEVSPFVKSNRYAALVKARRVLSAKGDYWPNYPREDWEANINLNLKSPEEVDPKHGSAWQPKEGRAESGASDRDRSGEIK